MKRFVIALVILAAIITAGVLESVHVERTFGELDTRIAALEDAIKSPTDSVALAETEGSLECGDDKNALSKCQSLLTMSRNLKMLLDFSPSDVI